MNITFHLNGKEVTIETRPDKRLSTVLREDLNLKGIRKGCSNGYCGNCVILMNDELVSSCIIPAFAARNKKIITIEGFSQTKTFADILEGFKEAGVQLCTFCAPSRVLSTAYMLNKHKMPTEEEIMETISSVHCRCSSNSLLKEGIILSSINYNKRKNSVKNK